MEEEIQSSKGRTHFPDIFGRFQVVESRPAWTQCSWWFRVAWPAAALIAWWRQRESPGQAGPSDLEMSSWTLKLFEIFRKNTLKHVTKYYVMVLFLISILTIFGMIYLICVTVIIYIYIRADSLLIGKRPICCILHYSCYSIGHLIDLQKF